MRKDKNSQGLALFEGVAESKQDQRPTNKDVGSVREEGDGSSLGAGESGTIRARESIEITVHLDFIDGKIGEVCAKCFLKELIRTSLDRTVLRSILFDFPVGTPFQSVDLSQHLGTEHEKVLRVLKRLKQRNGLILSKVGKDRDRGNLFFCLLDEGIDFRIFRVEDFIRMDVLSEINNNPNLANAFYFEDGERRGYVLEESDGTGMMYVY